MKFPRLDLDTKLNVIATDKDLKAKIGNPSMIKKQNRDTLLIEVKSDAQGNKLKEITALHDQPVQVTEHKTLNTCKGTVYSETMSNSSLQELQDALKDQQVSKIERMKRRVNGVLKDTHRHIITFNKPDLPQVIKLTDWHHELIDLYIPNPMRCMNCKRLGHTKKWCRRTSPTCSKCAEEHDPALGCNKPLRCVNCSEEHNALERKCPFYQFKCEVLATQTRKRVSFPEAEEEVRERFRQDGKQFRFVSYVSRVRGDVQNREVAQNATGGLDVEMAGNPNGLQQNLTEQQTAWEREPETPDTTVVVPEVHPEPQQPESDKQRAASGEAVTEVHRSMDSRTDKSPEPPKGGRGDKKQSKAPGHRSTKPDPSQGAIPIPNTTIVVPKVRPEPQQTKNDKQQAASNEIVVTEVHRTMDSQTGKNSKPPKNKKNSEKHKNIAPRHRSTKPDPSQGAIPKIPNEKLQHNENTLEDVQCLFQDTGEASTEMEQDDMIGNFFSNISKHTENLGRKRLLESVSPPPTTNKKEKVNEAEETAHVESEEKDRLEAAEPENHNNPIPVLGTSAPRTHQDKDNNYGW